MNPELFSTEKYRREHTATLKDIIFSRREFLEKTGMGFGAMSLASILGLNMGGSASAATAAGKPLGPFAPKAAPLPAQANAVIHILASGRPSHTDTWEPKPSVTEISDKTLPR